MKTQFLRTIQTSRSKIRISMSKIFLLSVLTFTVLINGPMVNTSMATEVFNLQFYLETYPDLKAEFGGIKAPAAQTHWKVDGIREGRRASLHFDAPYYLSQNPDLQKAFGSTNYLAAITHWQDHGESEGRRATREFDVTYYLKQYPDLQAMFGDDYKAAHRHWVTYGIQEGRRGSADFDPKSYLSRYQDLQAAFGNDYLSAIHHWIRNGRAEGRNGRAEGRVAVGPVEPPPSTTICRGAAILTAAACEGDGMDAEENKLVDLINSYRATKGLAAIASSPSLSLVANRHARDLEENIGDLTHDFSNCTIPPWECMWKAPQRLGTPYTGYGYENVYGGGAGATAETSLNGWKSSTEHNAVILNLNASFDWSTKTWRAIGVGIYKGYAVMWVGEEIDPAQ